MGQLNFQANFNKLIAQSVTFNNNSLTFFGFNIYDSLSFNNPNILISASSATTKSYSFSFGLYSLNGSTLSIANSASLSRTVTGASGFYGSFATSTTQNITPGTWYIGLIASSDGTGSILLFGQMTINPANAFPGAFIGGRMTASTNALPASVATSDLDITGNDAMLVPSIIINA